MRFIALVMLGSLLTVVSGSTASAGHNAYDQLRLAASNYHAKVEFLQDEIHHHPNWAPALTHRSIDRLALAAHRLHEATADLRFGGRGERYRLEAVLREVARLHDQVDHLIGRHCERPHPMLSQWWDAANHCYGQINLAYERAFGVACFSQPGFGQPGFGQPGFGQPGFGSSVQVRRPVVQAPVIRPPVVHGPVVRPSAVRSPFDRSSFDRSSFDRSSGGFGPGVPNRHHRGGPQRIDSPRDLRSQLLGALLHQLSR